MLMEHISPGRRHLESREAQYLTLLSYTFILNVMPVFLMHVFPACSCTRGVGTRLKDRKRQIGLRAVGGSHVGIQTDV